MRDHPDTHDTAEVQVAIRVHEIKGHPQITHNLRSVEQNISLARVTVQMTWAVHKE